MGTNPNLAMGTNGAFGGRTSVNAFNDVLGAFTGPGIVSGWQVAPQSGMTIAAGGVGVMRDVAIAEDTIGNRTTVNNRSGSPVPVEIPAASATTDRIDCVVAYVNSPATVNSTTLDNPEAVGLIDVKGTTSAPDDAAIRAAITADGGTGTTAYYVILATISVPAGTTVITQNLITQGAMVMARVLNGSINSSMIDWATIEPQIYSTQTKISQFFRMADGFSLSGSLLHKVGNRLSGWLCIKKDSGPYINSDKPFTTNASLVTGYQCYGLGYNGTSPWQLGTQPIYCYIDAARGNSCQIGLPSSNLNYIRIWFEVYLSN